MIYIKYPFNIIIKSDLKVSLNIPYKLSIYLKFSVKKAHIEDLKITYNRINEDLLKLYYLAFLKFYETKFTAQN